MLNKYIPKNQPVSNIVSPESEPKSSKIDPNAILGNNESNEIEDNIKKVSANDVINPTMK